VKSPYGRPVPVSCSDEPTGVLLASLDADVGAGRPGAGPRAAVSTPS
jgi:hypothetical protein